MGIVRRARSQAFDAGQLLASSRDPTRAAPKRARRAAKGRDKTHAVFDIGQAYGYPEPVSFFSV